MDNGWQDRWTYAVPVKPAWRITRTKVEAHHLFRRTFSTHNAMQVATRGEVLTPEEARAALALPVTPANVFGVEPLPPDQMIGETPMQTILEPSRGVTPSFGERVLTVEDAENRLYVLKLDGDVAAFLGRQRYEVARKMVIKVGYAREPQQRCDVHNARLPERCQFRWRVFLTSAPLPGGVEAKAAEDTLKQVFAKRFESLGGEFFLADEAALRTEFAQVSGASGLSIRVA